MSIRGSRPAALAAATAAAMALAAAPSALAAPVNSSWAGLGTDTNWSTTGNWDTAPTTPDTGNIGFGDLSTCDNGTAASGSACYTSTDNLGPLTARELSIGGGQLYRVYPNDATDTLTLDGNGGSPNVGLSATPSNGNLQLADFGVPIVLGADQQWNVDNYGILYLNTVSGPHALSLDLNNGYVQANDIENSSVTVSGPGDLQLDQFTGSPEKLPDVTLNDSVGTQSALTVASTNASSGAITVSGTDNNFIVLTDKAPGETLLQAGGDINLDNTTNVEFDIDGNNTTAGTDVSQLMTTHAVNFNGAAISLWQARDAGNCDTLATGKTYTIVQGGALSGQINIGGHLISPGGSATETLQSNSGDCPSAAAKTTAIVNYNANSVTATIAGAPVATVAPTISGSNVVGDKLTVDSNGSWTAAPAPTYSYQWESCAGSNCSPISAATGPTYTLASADVGKTIEVQVTATNTSGKASAMSNAIGPVKAAGSGSGGGGGGSTVTSAQIRAALAQLGYPRGRHALLLLIRRGWFRTHFSAPEAGTLSVTWRAAVLTGYGRHAKRHTYVVARGVVHATGAQRVVLTMHLTGMGRRLLRRHPFHLWVAATERFVASSGNTTTLIRRFVL